MYAAEAVAEKSCALYSVSPRRLNFQSAVIG